LYLGGHGPGILHTGKKPVRRLEDLKGAKIRCTGTSAPIAKALGATPVSMPVADAYDAIKRGVAEGIFISLEAMEGWKLGEVCKYSIGSYASAYSTIHFIVMNKNKWNALPSDIQKIIEEINGEWILRTGVLWDDKATRSVLDEWAKKTESKGLPGKAALQFCLERLKQVQ